ncbi:hypothetical protein N3K66_001596 [Trichothecium roseum]|uniref:Uncharacterized protein n=1 Tax=Trichothecium roseum TaxID=47278 RepID=A0ACC0VF22_9HYPO|nr:hypothetical protein N3K66_001596 [Trichothecium roseum]
MEWTKQTYNSQYEKWVPWLEDQYLRWFTRDNKVSYSAKEQLDKSKVTGISPVDNLQEGVNSTVAGQLGQGGALEPITDRASREGVNRAERRGRDAEGGYAPAPVSNVLGGAADGGRAVAGATSDGLKNVGGALSSPFSSNKENQQ